ncbi:hypothetical protein CHS0354_039216 [Potamilus streckersoni]|uniref:DNA excision repair protein ERCC-6 n=1 Tax=Potamilus streckersoni TaxID=2493646 RepID=A0AAE0TE22_9BIVA|nr:hypothetical protein CHS0354_039216 [Potamilus streckersoni]
MATSVTEMSTSYEDCIRDISSSIPLGVLNVSTPDSSQSQGEDSINGPALDKKSMHVFHVNKELIPLAHLDDQASAELQGLGLDVFNQEEFEQGVIAQVDEALNKEEGERKKKAWDKDLKNVQYDISIVQREVNQLDKVISAISGTAKQSGHTQRRFESVVKQKENKLSQLQSLKAKEISLEKKLKVVEEIVSDQEEPEDTTVTSPEYSEMLGLGSSRMNETESEKLIRTGAMTPFGTVINNIPGPSEVDSEKVDLKGLQSSAIHQTTKEEKKSSRCRSVSNKLQEYYSSDGMDRNSQREKNLFDDKDHKVYRDDVEGSSKNSRTSSRWKRPKLDHSFEKNPELSDYGDGEDKEEEERMEEEDQGHRLDSDEDYVPDDKELKKSEEEDDVSFKKPKRKKRKSLQNLPGYFHSSNDKSEDTEDSPLLSKPRKISGSIPVRKVRDDGDEHYYEKRLRELDKEERRIQILKERGEVSESESDEEFDGGLRVPGKIWSKLFNYQKTCVKWLWELDAQEAGGIIGDEMGLGKTIEMISFLAALRYSKLRDRTSSRTGLGASIVICPATVMHQWVKEFLLWWPTFRVAILHSSGSYTGAEAELVKSIIKSRGILITSYSTLVLNQDCILPHNWHYVILDEGHKIRNPDVQVTLCCKQFRTPHRIILSGSPIQNNLKELWSLFDFVFPGKLGTLPDFMQHFAVPIVQGGYANASAVAVQTAYKCACVLRDTINPYLLRRMKADVKIDLPSKSEQVLFCRLTAEQKDVYQQYLDSRECQSILSGKFMVFAGLITLRKICNHPDLSTGGPRVYVGDDIGDDKTLQYGYYERSGKMIVVKALLRLWKQQEHKVLLFSQSRQMLDILENFVKDEGYSYSRMDGTTPISARQPIIDRYNKDSNIYLLLLTTRVGGLGVNLTGANRIIIFDPDWNPSTDTQARERAWRIGQNRHVTIYRLITTGTIEEKIYHRQIFKQFLTNKVLKDPKQRRFFKTNDLYELFTLNISDDKRETETAAIFAGTGSEVRVRLRKVNVFDEIVAKKKAVGEKEDEYDEQKDEAEYDEQKDEADEIKRMRELAKKLSRMIGQGLFQKDKNSDESNQPTDAKKSEEKSPDDQSSSGDYVNKQDQQASEGHKRLSKHIKKAEEERPFIGSKNDESSNKKEKHKKKKHKHRRKHKDATFEGEPIPHLDKCRTYKASNLDEVKNQKKTEKEKQKMLDDYVLRTLFEKTDIQGAIKHDKIMNDERADYVIIESEADKVAKQAALALKRSRSQCLSATSGVPTWTGQHGGLVKKPKFGQKKNTLLAGPDDKDKGPSTSKTAMETPKASEGKLFDGSLAGCVQTNSDEAKSSSGLIGSQDLLNKMKTRNEIFKTMEQGGSGDPGLPDNDSFQLINNLRNFIMFEARMIGQATTQEILDEFGSKLPPSDSAKFRAMLHSICDLEKKDGIGYWKLRPDFR